MNLHRSGNKPDWEKLRARNRNYWQNIAASTSGIITPGNVISLTGFGLVLWGLWLVYADEVGLGLVLVVAGRILDVIDGYLAEKTGPKSPLGEAVDAGIDKIEIAVALPVLAVAGVLWPWQALLLAVLHIINLVCSLIARYRHVPIHASRLGKYATAAQWVAIALYGLAVVLDSLWILAHATFWASVLLGVVASYGYIRDTTS